MVIQAAILWARRILIYHFSHILIVVSQLHLSPKRSLEKCINSVHVTPRIPDIPNSLNTDTKHAHSNFIHRSRTIQMLLSQLGKILYRFCTRLQ